MVLRIFLRVIEQSLSANCPGAVSADKAALHIGAIAFIHRSNSSLNGHVHFHVCAVDGVFEEVADDTDAQSSPPGIVFHPASGVDATVVALVQADLRRRILRAFAGRGLLESCDAKEILTYQHSGFSVDAGVRIESHDRAALERLLRYCARPPFACGRLRKEGAELVYRCAKQHSEPAPAQPAKQVAVQTEPTATGEGAPGVTPLGHASPPMHEVFPLLCPLCGGQVRLIAFITEGTRESGRSLITSGWTPSPRTLPRHADHRFGMTATRRRMRGCALSPIGVWRRNRHRTLRSISASVGEWLRRRF
jgi:hypothetical protein